MSRKALTLLLCGVLLAFGIGQLLIGDDAKSPKTAPEKANKTAPKVDKVEEENSDAEPPKKARPAPSRTHSMPNAAEDEAFVLKEEAILEALGESMDVEFVDTPLNEALMWVKNQVRVDLWLDEAALSDEGVANDQPVNLSANQIGAESVLNLILTPLGLEWLVEDEVLKVTTRVKAATILETRVYSVGELYDAGHSPDMLIDVVVSCVAPSTWDEAGGAGTIRAVANSLAVRQTQRIQSEVEALLSDLLTVVVRDEAEGKPASRERIALRVYQTGGHSAEKLAQSLEKLVEPHSWEAGGGPGLVRAVDGALLVKQTARIHGELERILHDLNPPVMRGHLSSPLLPDSDDDDDDDDDDKPQAAEGKTDRKEPARKSEE